MRYLTLASLAVGMTVTAVRWATIDQLHVRTGLPIPRLDFSTLGRNVEAISPLTRIHYEHYMFYANEFVALAVAYTCYRVKIGGFLPLGGLNEVDTAEGKRFFRSNVAQTVMRRRAECLRYLPSGAAQIEQGSPTLVL